jgi:hypothetical protein
VVGFYALSGSGPVRELEHMWASPGRMGSGVGRALRSCLRMGARVVGEVPSSPHGRTLPLLLRGAR